MFYGTIEYNNENMLCCVDPAGERVFPLDAYFKNNGMDVPEDMTELIEALSPDEQDDIAFFFGSFNHDLALRLKDVKIKSPFLEPKRSIVCLGKNYADHAKEIQHLRSNPGSDTVPKAPIYFTKATHTVIGPEDTILMHTNATSELDYEVELAVVIGKKGINIAKEDAEDHIFGYTIANDISARDLQTKHLNWFKGKSLTTHCPLGPWIVHKSLLPLPIEINIKSYVNGELRQNSNTRELIFDIPEIISDLSKGYELRPGDIILTGTPAGVGIGFVPAKYLASGDEIICEIEGIGTLKNYMEMEK